MSAWWCKSLHAKGWMARRELFTLSSWTLVTSYQTQENSFLLWSFDPLLKHTHCRVSGFTSANNCWSVSHMILRDCGADDVTHLLAYLWHHHMRLVKCWHLKSVLLLLCDPSHYIAFELNAIFTWFVLLSEIKRVLNSDLTRVTTQ